MPHTRPLFGVTIPKAISAGADPAGAAQHAEALGFDVVTLHPDHLHGVGPSLEMWTALTWVAARTATIRIAPCILSLPYRHPALVAKMAESLDRLSGGRLILAMGAGDDSMTGAFSALGLVHRSGHARVEALEEAIDVIRALWAGDPVFHDGELARLAGATLEPAPEHQIPIWVGAFGPRMAELIGRKADGWLPSLFLLDLEIASKRMREIRQAAVASGRHPDEITCGCNVSVFVGSALEPRMGRISGTAAEVASGLTDLIRRGFRFLNLWPAGDAAIQRERLAEAVVPRVLEATRGGEA